MKKIIKQKFILDESGSMASQQNVVISGFNEQIETMKMEQKEKDVEYLVTLVKFSYEPKFVYKDVPVNDVKPLTIETYKPGGATALLEAIGNTIDTAQIGESDTVVTIFTDGQENASRTWKKNAIKILIDIRQRENKWGFVFFGANFDAFADAASIGIANAVNYTMNNMSEAIKSMSVCRSAYTDSALSGVYNVSSLTANINKDDLVK